VARSVATWPNGTVRWRSFIILMPVILDPLPNVAKHIVKAERVWFERTYGCCLFLVPLGATAKTVCVIVTDRVTPGVH
jgi:hypothetical protein